MQLEKSGNQIKNIQFKKNQIVIQLLSGEEIITYENVFTNFYLYVGKELLDSEIKKIKEENELYSLKKYLLNLINKKLYSQKEIEKKLLFKKVDKQTIDKLISYLKEFNFINDQKLIKILNEEYQLKLYGEKKILFNLQERGLPNNLIASLSFDRENEIKKAKQLINQYLKKEINKSSLKIKNDLYAYLIRNGYSNEIAINLIEDKNYFSKKVDEAILFKTLQKYVIIHKVDLFDSTQKDKLIKRFLNRGFSINLINKGIKEILDGKIS